jgi:hypothetical protein
MSLLMEGVLNPDNCQESEGREEERVIRLFLLVRGGDASPGNERSELSGEAP